VRYLDVDVCKKLINACPADFRALVRGALATGCRYGELVRLSVADFNHAAGTVSVRISKAGKPRHVALNEEGRAFFLAPTENRPPSDLIFRRQDGEPWGASHQQRPLIAASEIAKIAPPATFHILRHTYGSALATKGVPMGVIAAHCHLLRRIKAIETFTSAQPSRRASSRPCDRWPAANDLVCPAGRIAMGLPLAAPRAPGRRGTT
jgi:integrase